MTTTPAPNYLAQSITDAIRYLDDHGHEVPLDLRVRARHLTAKAGEGLAAVGAVYRNVITDALIGYFEGGNVVSARNAFRKGTVEAFTDAFDLGWLAGGQELPPDKDAQAWFASRLEAELGFVGMLFEQARELRKDEEFDFFAWITQRADGYIATLTSVYNAGRMFAKKIQMLTWKYGDTEHCSTCNKLNGQRHRASWYIARNYFPGQPGAAMECGGYRCKCSLLDDDGKVVTI